MQQSLSIVLLLGVAAILAPQALFTIREGFFFDLTGNATNALNHPSFGQPDRLIGLDGIGNITSARVPSRQIEIVFRLRF